MPSCTLDWNPIIIAIGGIMAVQTPILVAALIKSFDAARDRRTLKELTYATNKKVDDLTLITTNGFHGPKGEQGAQGAPGRDAPGRDEPPQK